MSFPFSKKKTPSTPSEKSSPAGGGRDPKKPPRSKYERLPLFAILLYGLFGVSLILYIIMTRNVAFADWFNGSVGAAVRSALSLLTSWIPFSTGEAVILLLPLALFLVLRLAVRRYCGSWRAAFVYVGILFSVVATLFSVFTMGFAAGYRSSALDQKLELDRAPVSAQELYDTAVILIDNINRETEGVGFGEERFSVMPYSLTDMNRHLNEAYDLTVDEYDFITHVDSRVKPVLVSEVMSYMHITGVYSFFTGEANINVNFPDYTIPYTAAHEMAHQRGIAREDEANFAGFLACVSNERADFQYSAYYNAFLYCYNALYRADQPAAKEVLSGASELVRSDMGLASAHYQSIRSETASQITDQVYDSYLKGFSVETGVQSYGEVADLLLIWYFERVKG